MCNNPLFILLSGIETSHSVEPIKTNHDHIAKQMFSPLDPIYYGEVKPKPNQQSQVNKPDPIQDCKQQRILSQSKTPASINESPMIIPAETFSYRQ